MLHLVTQVDSLNCTCLLSPSISGAQLEVVVEHKIRNSQCGRRHDYCLVEKNDIERRKLNKVKIDVKRDMMAIMDRTRVVVIRL